MSRYFSLGVWGPYITREYGEIWLFGLDFDWLRGNDDFPGHLSVTGRLLGFGACLTYYPRGKA